MYHDVVKKVSTFALSKMNVMVKFPFKYFMRCMMAGFFVVAAMIFSNVTASIFVETAPEWGKLLSSFVFALAILLIAMIGGELFTGNNFVMAFAVFDKKLKWNAALRNWIFCFMGNLVGCVLFSLIFVGANASGASDYFGMVAIKKLFLPVPEMFFRAILCNFFVCLAVLSTIKLTSEAGKIVMVFLCIAAFCVSGFEHCIANMGLFTVSYLLGPEISLLDVLKSMTVVTLGNVIGGAILLAWPLRRMSLDE